MQTEGHMSTKTYYELIKAILFIAVLAFLGFAGLQAYTWINMKLAKQEEMFNAEMEAQRQKLELEINQWRAETSVVTANDAKWKEEMTKLDQKRYEALMQLIKDNSEKIQNVGEINSKMNEKLSIELKKMSEHSFRAGTGDLEEQYFQKIYAKEKDADGNEVKIPIGWAMFYPNKPDNEKWKTGIYPIEYKTKVVQTEQKDGQWNTYVETWAENNKDKESVGKELPLKIELAEFTQLKKKDKEFFWWAPHLNLNLDFGLGTDIDANVGGGLSFSTSGYGRTENDLTWRFIDFGLSTNGDDVWGKFTPFAYNIGEHIPFVSNTFLGPFVGYEFNDGSWIGGIGLSIPF